MSCQNPEVSALIESLRQSLLQRGPGGSYNREQLKETAERLSIALEPPGETCQRVAYYPLRTTIVRIANRLNILHSD
ncbi:hypothetical protein JMJ35_007836 [Cladonia borealis]|uniref:Uncharacterized protein n=1 Tax=Cladonia borealis TaxID=184061 RepID=A0AA39UZ87_9LECA|nr:hypothetical protein JMJ35_007836 [Cladonia borealis]